METERLRQTHSKEIESKDEEVEEIRQSCSKKVLHTRATGNLI
jgi:myosin-18